MGYDNTNKGVLFKNKDKKTDTHPDYNGSIDIDGVEYWLSAWINEDKNGKKYMTLARGDEKNPGPNSESMREDQPNEGGDVFEDDGLPF